MVSIQARSRAKVSQPEMRRNFEYGIKFNQLLDHEKLLAPEKWGINYRTLQDWGRVAYRFDGLHHLVEQMIDIHVPSHVIISLSSSVANCSYTNEELEEFVKAVKPYKAPGTEFCNTILRKIRAKKKDVPPQPPVEEHPSEIATDNQEHILQSIEMHLQEVMKLFTAYKRIPQRKRKEEFLHRDAQKSKLSKMIWHIAVHQAGPGGDDQTREKMRRETTVHLSNIFGHRNTLSVEQLQEQEQYLWEHYPVELADFSES